MTMGVVAGPAIAVSPTGLNLAMGPPGLTGRQGPPGPPGLNGAAGAAINPMVSLTLASASIAVGSTTPNTDYSVEVASNVATVSGSPPDGLVLQFTDSLQLWTVAAPFTFVAQAGAVIRDPGNIAGADVATVHCTLTGASVRWKWKASLSKWLSV